MNLPPRLELKRHLRFGRKSKSLFHYTTAHGLLGIVSGQSLFATHADFSNDTTECKIVSELLKKVVASEYKDIVPKVIERGILQREYLIEYGRHAIDIDAETAVRSMLKAANNTAPFFITSFCVHDRNTEAYENGLLSQWRGYARGGFAIEFDEFSLDKLCADEYAGWRYQGMMQDVVSYGEENSKFKPEDFKGMAGAFFRTILPPNAPNLDDILGTASVKEFGAKFLAATPFLKHKSFEEEREYRIATLCNRRNITDEGDERLVKNIQFKAGSNGNVVPYICLFEGLKTQLPIRSIIVGPHAQQQNQRGAVELLLERFEIEANVRLSKAPFRE